MGTPNANRMLKIAFIDSEGVCYHEAILGPKQAKELLVRNGVHQIRFGGFTYPINYLTLAEAKRQPRAITAKNPSPLGGEILITPNE